MPTPQSSLNHGIAKYRWVVILAWIALAVALHGATPPWSQVARDGDLDQLPANTDIAIGNRLDRLAFPEDVSKSQVVLVAARSEGQLTIKDREYAISVGRSLAAVLEPQVVDVWTEKTPAVGPSLLSRSGRAVRLVIRLKNEFMATENIDLLHRVREVVDTAAAAAPRGLELGISGSAPIGGDMLTAAAESVKSTHLTTMLLVSITLVAIYRSPTLVLVPLIAIGLATTISLDTLGILAGWSKDHPDVWPAIQVFTTTKIFVIVILFGSGTDYCLFLTARFRELRLSGHTVSDALYGALANVGLALVASALTTIVGLAMMGFADFGKFAYSGPTIAICLVIALADCLTLVPAMLATKLGSSISQGSGQPVTSYWEGFWSRIADAIDRRPGLILAACCVLGAPLAWYGWGVPTTYDLLGELSPDRATRRGTDLLRQYFPPGEIGPVVVLADLPAGGLDKVEGQFTVAELVKPLNDLPGVYQVRSLYQPLGDPPGTVRLFSSEGWLTLAAKGSPLTKAVFVSQTGKYADHLTRLFVTLKAQPFSTEAVATCDQIDQTLKEIQADPKSPWHNATFAFTGPTVGIRDLERITSADRTRIQILVTIAVLVVILILLRRVRICLFLIFSVVLSYLITIGASDLVFSFWRGADYVGLDWKVPLFLFVLLVAVGQDYNIYLVSRVLEEQRTAGPRNGLKKAVIQTGGIITSCGIIMAGTFISMTTAELNGMVELGFALTLGILLDTLLVRTVFVPAFLALLARRYDLIEAGSIRAED